MVEHDNNPLPEHGGDLVTASKQYGIALDHWIDLSTGINPEPYPVENINPEAFTRLPYQKGEFIDAVNDYYGRHAYAALSGTQTAIELLPGLLPDYPVLLPEVGYSEHLYSWQRHGHSIYQYPSYSQAGALESIKTYIEQNNQRHIVVIQPNNPTGLFIEHQELTLVSNQLSKGAYLIVDEAFMDVTPERSLLNHALPDNVIVMRSFGKFFGLAGIRLGFCFAHASLISRLEEKLILWSVNGPAQWLATKALKDVNWQCKTRERLFLNAQATQQLFSPLWQYFSLIDSQHTALFSSYVLPADQAKRIYQQFAQAGILLRLFLLEGAQAILRVGILSTGQISSFSRVEAAVKQCVVNLERE